MKKACKAYGMAYVLTHRRKNTYELTFYYIKSQWPVRWHGRLVAVSYSGNKLSVLKSFIDDLVAGRIHNAFLDKAYGPFSCVEDLAITLDIITEYE